jgi:monothiol glutaredoxin
MSNTPPQIRQITAHELKVLIESARTAGAALELWDVRTEEERRMARIEGTRLLDAEGAAYIEELDRDTPLVFHCHHGIRSQAAAQYFLARGFTNLCNLVGGIDAWSTQVDPAIPRY